MPVLIFFGKTKNIDTILLILKFCINLINKALRMLSSTFPTSKGFYRC